MTIRSAFNGRFLSIVLGLGAATLLATPAFAQMAAGKAKFVGNVTGSSVPSNFNTYWNQVTPENGTKWGSVEGTQNQMNWSVADAGYNYAQSHGYKFKFHTLVWGSQFPSWLSGLSQAQQRAEIEQWITLAGQHFPAAWAVDVVNEPTKTPLPWKAALGGDGATGWDWVITSFQLARVAFPNAKLLINEYGTENDPNARNQYKTIINLLKARGLIDGIGIQSHYFNVDSMNGAAVTAMLNDYATLGLDVYVSEMDIVGSGGDAAQLAKYQDVFPAFWNHASVKGFTLWGYIVGQTWRDGTGLVTTAGVERPAMTWLKGFVSGSSGGDTQAPSVPANLTSPAQTSSSISLAWSASTDNTAVTGYQVLRAPGASGGTFAQIGTATTTSFTNSALAASTTFRYQVRAVDAAGNASAVSAAVTATTLAGGGGDTQAPSVPANLTSPSTTASSISLAWSASTDNTGVTGYQLLRAPGASGGTFAQIGTSTTTSFTDSSLAASTTFRYQVRAVDAAGNASAVSNAVTATTQAGGTGGGCSVAPTVQTQWQTGYVIEPARVTNTGTATINSWTVTFTLPAGHTITGSWNTVLTVSGQIVTARNATHNGTVAAGGNTAFGFQVSRPNGNTQLPTGYACTSP
ncbi:MAG TPA: endo-1,4-beta-xylanase [Steroidobacteraceae bacterium]|jgi:endo-1,4-beta-xylanase|nr:endo-1,4-beta-xylanase [Steroidobacteraceae bacterium]